LAVVAMKDVGKMKVLVRESHKEKVALHNGRNFRCGSNEGVHHESDDAEDRFEVELVLKDLRKKSFQYVGLDALKLFAFYGSSQGCEK
jgi:hypothetical protein